MQTSNDQKILFCAEHQGTRQGRCDKIARGIRVAPGGEPYPVCPTHFRYPLAPIGVAALEDAKQLHKRDTERNQQ